MIEAYQTRCATKCQRYRLSEKKICELKCKIEIQQKIISGIRRAAIGTNNIEAREKFSKDIRRAQIKLADYQRQLVKLTAHIPEIAGVVPTAITP